MSINFPSPATNGQTYAAPNGITYTYQTPPGRWNDLGSGGSGGSPGTVTSTSVVNANGLDGTVATATTTPAITMKTTVTGMVKGNGTALSAATAGTDYMTPADVTSLYLPLAGGTLSGQLNSTTARTGVSEPAINVQQTWNNAATNFTTLIVNAINTNSGAGSYLAQFQVGGAPQFWISKVGSIGLVGSVAVGATGLLYFTNRSLISSPADSQILLRNFAATDFNRLQFGGTTTAFPAIKRNLTALNFRLADDSADAPITAAAATLSGTLTGTTATMSTAISAASNDTTVPTTAWVKANGAVMQTVSTQTGAVATGTTVIPIDDTIPQITEGDQYMTLAITPRSATSKLIIDVTVFASNTAGARIFAALFQDSTANALAAGESSAAAVQVPANVTFTHTMTSGTTSATTFRVRAGGGAVGTTTFNGGGGVRQFGGVMASSIVIQEVSP